MVSPRSSTQSHKQEKGMQRAKGRSALTSRKCASESTCRDAGSLGRTLGFQKTVPALSLKELDRPKGKGRSRRVPRAFSAQERRAEGNGYPKEGEAEAKPRPLQSRRRAMAAAGPCPPTCRQLERLVGDKSS